jgi:hypothetical protein
MGSSGREHAGDGCGQENVCPEKVEVIGVTDAGMPASAWSAAFASAPRSAMAIYAEVRVPRMFEP